MKPEGGMSVMAARQSEEWRRIPSFPDYEVSSLGRIRKDGRLRKARPNEGGYLQLNLMRDGKIYSRRVHAMVCEAFHGLRPDGLIAAHRDGVRTNNVPSNLRWATYAENSADMVAHGTRLSGEAHPRAILSQADVDRIRSVYAANRLRSYVKRGTRERLARELGVGVHVIKDVVGGRCWQ